MPHHTDFFVHNFSTVKDNNVILFKYKGKITSNQLIDQHEQATKYLKIQEHSKHM